ncbi:hypothetical protein HYDPIDRAFT_26163 [Hydnomerulius pinastri MD-312]|nr:hypothetical protein HYDPIDRAFT_26163 [Hydnomerulius pinastri MD-312]
MNQALSQLDKIKKDFSVFRAQSDALKRKQMKNGRFVDLYRVLRQSCDLIRSAEEHEDTDLRAIIDEVEVFVAEVVRYATDGRFGHESLVEHLESFAHRWPPVESMPRNFESDDGEETPDKQGLCLDLLQSQGIIADLPL